MTDLCPQIFVFSSRRDISHKFSKFDGGAYFVGWCISCGVSLSLQDGCRHSNLTQFNFKLASLKIQSLLNCRPSDLSNRVVKGRGKRTLKTSSRRTISVHKIQILSYQTKDDAPMRWRSRNAAATLELVRVLDQNLATV